MNEYPPHRPPLPSSARIRSMEDAAYAKDEATFVRLMERAADAVLNAVLNEWPGIGAPRTRILCSGHAHGGYGYALAGRLVAQGCPVDVIADPDIPPTAPDPRRHAMEEMRRRWQSLAPAHGIGAEEADLLVDARQGIGKPPAPNPATAPSGTRTVAIDLPYGLDADSGHAHADGSADLTVALHAAKPGHYLGSGPEVTGRLVIADLGLPVEADLHLGTVDASRLRKANGHKFDHGHALVLAGPHLQGGAARMSARAALRIGAGVATLVAPTLKAEIHAAHLDAIMLRTADTADDLSSMLEDTRINALCAGPGMGVDRAWALLPTLLSARRATVLDADALTALAGSLHLLHDRCVLTPHPGEFARLFPDLSGAMKAGLSKPDAVRQAAAQAGCTVLLKGRDTFIADASGRAVLVHASHDRAAPWLATAGAGDVLAGMIAGLLARGLPPFQAAESAAWLHIEAARHFGPGLIAEDLPDQLPGVFRALGL